MELSKTTAETSKNISSIRLSTKIKYCQYCLLCENTRDLPEGMHHSSTPWICSECKEAIAFAKQLKASVKATPEGKRKEIKVDIEYL